MDLINSIFDDKRSKNRSSGKSRDKSGTQGVKKKRPIKSDEIDKKPKTILKNTTVFNDEKHNGIKNVVRQTSNEKNVKKKEIEKENGLKKKDSTKSCSSIKKDGSKKEIIEAVDKTIDPSMIRNVSKYLDTNYHNNLETCVKNPFEDCVENSFENSFETALEVYNECVIDEKDADFGRESFTSLDKDYFVEAYNKEGSELLETWIQLSFNESSEDPPEELSTFEPPTFKPPTFEPPTFELPTFEPPTFEQPILEPPTFEPSTVDKIMFVSDDEDDELFECYNSRQYELRKIRMKDKIQYGSRNLEENKLTRLKSTNSDYRKSEHVIKRELKNRDSMEEENIEEKSIQELIKATHRSFISERRSVQRSSSGFSSGSDLIFNGLSRNNSTSSRGSYSLGYSESFIEEDEDFPKLKLSFSVNTRADMIIQELLETEYTYIENLTIIKRDYINYFKRLELNASQMFGNIEEILKETKNFYRSLHLCGNDCEYIAKTVEDYRHLFKLYPKYSLNKLKADNLVQKRFKPILQDRQKTLGHKLDLASYLLNPVQRLGRYILLLKSLQKSIRKPDCLDNALQLVEQSMKRGNDYIAIASISDCSIDLSTKGSYIDREKFTLLKPKREEIVLFLFEKIVVFTWQKANTENFVYKNSINLDDLQIIHTEGDNQVFQLKNYTKSKKGNQELSYTLEGRSDKLTETWVQLIQSKLWEQLQQVKASSKTYKLPEVNENKKINISNSMKNDKESAHHPKRGRTSSDRHTVKGRTKFYVDETANGYDTL